MPPEKPEGGESGGFSAHLERLDVLLGVGVDHLDGARFLPLLPWSDLGSEDAKAVVDGPGSDEHSLRLLGNLAVERGHQHRKGLDEGHLGLVLE